MDRRELLQAFSEMSSSERTAVRADLLRNTGFEDAPGAGSVMAACIAIVEEAKAGRDPVKFCRGMIEELAGKAGKEKVGDIKAPEPGFVDAIHARVADKIREVKGRPGKHDRSEAVAKILEDLIAEMAPPVTDPNAPYMAIVQQRDEVKKVNSRVDAKLNNVNKQLTGKLTYRSLLAEDSVKESTRALEKGEKTTAVLEEPPTGKDSSTFVMALGPNGKGRPQLLVNIPLKSTK